MSEAKVSQKGPRIDELILTANNSDTDRTAVICRKTSMSIDSPETTGRYS